jgi:hypothetical protein
LGVRDWGLAGLNVEALNLNVEALNLNVEALNLNVEALNLPIPPPHSIQLWQNQYDKTLNKI